MSIPKNIRLQFQTILQAAEQHHLCLTETTNRKTGKTVHLLCAHTNENLYPLAQLGALKENYHPQLSQRKLI